MDERKRRISAQKRREALLRKKRQQQKRMIIYISSAVLLCVIIFICIFSFSCSAPNDDTVVTPTISPTPTPTATPLPSYIGKTDITAASAEFSDQLPLIKNITTDEKVIAITIDDLDLNMSENLEEIINVALQYNAKLTLFPVGTQLYHDKSIRDSLLYAFSKGFEIENHTMRHDQVYKLSNEEFYNTVVEQQNMVNQTLGVDYIQRFFRLPGGNGTADPRTHFYLKYLGYEALLDWSISGSDLEIEKIKSRLEPGSIILFHTTSSDTRKIKKLIPYAVSKGYRIVTLNELLVYSDNLCYALGSQDVPPFVDYEYDEYLVMGKGHKAYCVGLLQERLIQLGYLPSDSVADGNFGSQTEAAVMQFQTKHGLEATGKADVAMQAILFSQEAQYASY